MTLPPDRFPRCLAAWSSYAWARFKTSCILFKSEAGKPAALCKRAECPRCGLPAILILTVSVVIPESAGPFRALGARVACASGAPRFHGRFPLLGEEKRVRSGMVRICRGIGIRHACIGN